MKVILCIFLLMTETSKTCRIFSYPAMFLTERAVNNLI